MRAIPVLLSVSIIGLLAACSDKPATSSSATQPAAAAAPAAAPVPKAKANANIGPADLYLGMPASQLGESLSPSMAQLGIAGGLNGGRKDHVYLERDIFGNKVPIDATINDGKVVAIEVDLGPINQQQYQTASEALAKNYTMITASKAEMDDFNATSTFCFAEVNDSKQVALRVRHGGGDKAPTRQAQLQINMLEPAGIAIIYQSPEAMTDLIKSCGPHSLLKAQVDNTKL